MTNPFRNGILEIFDTLAFDLGWHGVQHELARTVLKSALKKSTEVEALQYIQKINKLSGDLLLFQVKKKNQ